MIRIIFRITYDWRVGLLLMGLILSLLLSASVLPLEQPANARAGPAAPFIPRGGGRHFYLTEANYATNATLTACASGYHMASLWEILDASNLSYDYAHPAAHNQADDGYGPPSSWNGWVRTGYFSSNVNVAGTGNCNNWSSVANTDYGVSVKLANAWETAPGDISTWDATSFTCNFIGPVWCVGDFHSMYLPFLKKKP